MTIGIISDTHGYYHPNIPDALVGVDAILHAGDIGTDDILVKLGELAPTYAVYGNIDGPVTQRNVPKDQHLEFDGLRFWMTHIGGHPNRWANGITELLFKKTPDVFVCGHSHLLRIERVPSLGGMLFVNPGAAGRQGLHKVKTCVRLIVEDGQATNAEVVHLDEEG
jgi:putative phosphoesterase